MSESHTGEIPFPQQKGTLMVRKISFINPEYGITKWVPQSEQLLVVTEIGKPGEPWCFKNIARIIYDGNQRRGEPDFGSSRDFITSAGEKNVKVDYAPASSEDLERFLSSLDQFYREERNWDAGLEDFLRKIESQRGILPEERKRIKKAFSIVKELKNKSS